ncbi:hypothetical protein SNE25_15900 [Mucilaginibacter sabulilitoris]|uniref:Lipoprotein n=1 Tax=Mucilaginibacter sabulilitoris TaxID=1173583 RepID=A0ABZ0TV70_9SPHI|nr:hypothetical protein [Mucilaginibacter sabulilitoris]WPU97005.1 hypothetical protein SNE25_15900 [Mucilaginibacter sabulilitoris]
MKNKFKVIATVVVFSFTLWRCSTPHSNTTTNQGGLPTDAYPSCTLRPDTFNSWFAGKNATENGLVTPANSVGFPHQDNCDFYQWAERMFSWVTSPASGVYGQTGTIMESPVFYSVSPVDSANQRILIPHVQNTLLRMSNHLEKNGPNKLPVIKDKKTGRLFEIETPAIKANIKALVKNDAGAEVEVDHVQTDAKGAIVFMDKAGKPIQHPKAIIQHKNNSQNIVHRFAVGQKFVFLDSFGNFIESEEGQATNDALMTKNGALVYYLSFVNDVYAYYLTGAKNGQISGSQFPTTAAARDSICAIARANHITLPDSNALAMELKTSWVEASTLADPENYVTVNASIPTYDTTSSKQWLPKGEKIAKMALVGIHIVGSVAGHPEMVWATFEHQNNTPNASFQYVDINKKIVTVPQQEGTNWLFNANAADTPYNVSHMKAYGDTIKAKIGHNISPSNTLQALPWGSAMDSVTNQQDKSSAASNSEIISINNTIHQLLVGNDIRKNYILIGATWTDGGAAPTGISYGSDTTSGVSIGTSVLANSTMETYFQSPKNSCFTCHSNGPANPVLFPDTLSHIYSKLQPLIVAHDLLNKKKKK